MVVEFLRQVRQTVERHNMLQLGDKIVVGVSGGPDSMALLKALQLLKDHYHVSLFAAHFNHRIRRDESDREAAFVRAQTETMEIPLITEEDDGSLLRQHANREETARKKRYDFFQRVASETGAHKIALGHTANDQAETFFLWMLRGSGPKGLRGMLPVRDGFFIRPLIETEKKEIVEFLRGEGVPWVEDSSNQERIYLRNKIRHVLIPNLQDEFDRKVIGKIVKTTEILRDEDCYLEKVSFEKYVELRKNGKENDVHFIAAELEELPAALRRRIIRHAIKETKKSLRGITFAHVEAILALLKSDSPQGKISLPHGLSAYREYEYLIIGHILVKKVPFRHEFNSLPNEIRVPEINRMINIRLLDWNRGSSPRTSNNTALMDFKALKFPLIIRNWKEGDRFRPLGTHGAKKIKDFFIDRKLPQRERQNIPLILFDDVIAWVGGQRIDERVKITDSTEKAILMELR